MTMDSEQYEIFAIRYARRDAKRHQHFVGGDPHDAPMPMDYFVWLVRNAARTFVVDTGFTREMADKRKRNICARPAAGLALLGVDAAKVKDVIHHAPALRSRRHVPRFPEGAVSPAGRRDDVRDGPPYAAHAVQSRL